MENKDISMDATVTISLSAFEGMKHEIKMLERIIHESRGKTISVRSVYWGESYEILNADEILERLVVERDAIIKERDTLQDQLRTLKEKPLPIINLKRKKVKDL